MKKLMKNIIANLKLAIFPFVLIILGTFCSNAQFGNGQFSIFGYTDVVEGTEYNYLLSSNTLVASSTTWSVSGGQRSFTGVLDVKVIWGAGPIGTLSVNIVDSYGDTYTAEITVNITPLIPPKPTAPTVQSTNCGNTILQRGSPPSGDTWYWQSDENGKSTASSSTTKTLNSGTIYYLRAQNSSGVWSTTSSSVSYSVTQPTTWYADTDGDGFGDPNTTQSACSQPTGYVSDNTDQCPTVSGQLPTTWYADTDGDGFGDPNTTQSACSQPTGYVSDNTDQCPTVSGQLPTTWYADTDGDGFGDPNTTQSACSQPLGYVSDNTDQCLSVSGKLPTTWYADTDSDGLGDNNNTLVTCSQPTGYVSNNTDQCPTEYGMAANNGCHACTPSNENYVYTITPQIESTDVSALTNDEKIENINYFDGLGRPMQRIDIRAGGAHEDIVTHIAYDDYGRQNKDYLPYTNTSNCKAYQTTAESDTKDYYYNAARFSNDFVGLTQTTINPYSAKHFEASPLNRVLEQAAPGEDWKLGSGHEIKFEYDTNTTGEVKIYNVTTSYSGNSYDAYIPTLIGGTNNYDSGELYKTITKDENWEDGQTYPKDHTTEEFKNKQGQVILKRTYNTNIAYDTYYVYDDLGNLTYVLPPKAEAQTVLPNAVVLENLCYQYKYDARNRLVEKKIPGKDWECIIYDNLDRPVLTQDALLREDDKWLFTKYDAFSRVTYTGIYTHTGTEDQGQMQNTLNTFYTNNTTANLFEEKQATEGNSHWYSNQSFPNTNLEILTVNYFDTYVFTIPTSVSLPTTVWETNDVVTNVKTLATGSKVKVLDANNWITTITSYDEKARPIWVGSHNEYLETTDIVKSKLDFVGNVETTVSIHKKTGNDDIVVEDTFTYDHMNRLISQSQEIRATEFDTTNEIELDGTTTSNAILYIAQNSITLKPGFTGLPGFEAKVSTTNTSNEKELIVLNTYDELGLLESKKVGGEAENLISNSTGLQTVDYAYNIRGWLKTINQDTNNTDNDLFNFSLAYNTPTDITKALFNGNISQTNWNSASVNATNNPVSNQYTYTYDALNRITAGIDNTGHYNLNSVSYDKNGNILDLEREGHVSAAATSFDVMDHLVYTYLPNSNQLMKVLDDENTTFGFKDGTNTGDDYTYDANGNMIIDENKGITNISYNHLNLPIDITFNNGNYISYKYDASGIKLSKTVEESSDNPFFTFYAGNYIYNAPEGEDAELQFFNHSEGYVKADNNSFDYVYQYKDHLGNVRLSYGDINNDGIITASTEIIEESNYYPFGLKHKGYNNVVSSNGNSVAQRWKFGGKEYNEELGLDWYDISARNYDPALGRWMNIDPLAEKMRRHSPYNYAFDNPIYFIDPDGMSPAPPIGLFGYALGGIKRTIKNYQNGDNIVVAAAKAFRDDPLIEAVADEIPGAGEALDVSKGNYGNAALGIIPFAKKIKKGVEIVSDAKKVTKKIGPLPDSSIKKQALDVKKNLNNGKNSVEVGTTKGKTHFDLDGASHKGVDTPHVQQSVTNTNPKTGETFVNKNRKDVKPMNQQDIRTVKKVLKKRKEQ